MTPLRLRRRRQRRKPVAAAAGLGTGSRRRGGGWVAALREGPRQNSRPRPARWQIDLLRFRLCRFDSMRGENRFWKDVSATMRETSWPWIPKSNKRHYKYCREVKLSNGEMMKQIITFPKSPSDWRASNNAKLDLRRRDEEIRAEMAAIKNASKQQRTPARRTVRK